MKDQGPTDCCDYRCNQGRNCPARMTLQTREGGERVDTDMPQPTDSGDWVPFDKTSEILFWAGFIALVIALFSTIASLTFFFFI